MVDKIGTGSQQAQQFVNDYDWHDGNGPDGVLDREEFRLAFKNGIRNGDALLEQSGCKTVDELFDKIDANGSEGITARELDIFFGRIAPPSGPTPQSGQPPGGESVSPQTQAFVDAYDWHDADGADGVLDREEFRHAFQYGVINPMELLTRAGCRNVDELFDKIDEDRSGTLTAREIDDFFASLEQPSQGASPQTQAFVDAYDWHDADGADGVLDRQEFRHAFQYGVNYPMELLTRAGCRNVDELFDKIDENRSGTLTAREIDDFFDGVFDGR